MGKKIIGMASKAAGPRGSARRRWSLLLSLVFAIGFSMVLKQTLFAVHSGTPFELDHVVTNAGPPPTGPGANVTSQTGDDWDKVCFAKTNDPSCGSTASLAASATAAAWTADCLRDPNTGLPQTGLTCGNLQATFFQGGGSKDPEQISSWAWKDDSGGIPDKDNLLHAFAVRYVVPSSPSCPGPGGNTDGTTNCDVLYFGSDRFDNSGDAQQGFWFLQSAIALGTNAVGGGTGFTGSHTNGDLLVISDFSNGGTTSKITVYKWNSACLGDGKPLAACSSANLERLTPLDQNSSCYTQLDGDPFCGVVNNVGGVAGQPAWDFLNKAGQALYDQNELFEAGVNLSSLGLAGECFSTVVAETRTSTSPTARLMDFVLGQFAVCAPNLTTDVVSLADNAFVTPGTAVTDRAIVQVTGASSPADPLGSVTFFLCGPSTSVPNCDGTTGNVGTQVGNAISLSNAACSPASTVDNDGLRCAVSVSVNETGQSGIRGPLSPGQYCFRAVADLSNYSDPSPHTNTTSECFQVRDTSATTTAQRWLPNDEATVTLTSGGSPSGTVTFDLFESADCTGTPVATFADIAVSGGKASTNNISNYTSSITVSWKATFTPTNSTAVTGSVGACEKSVLTIDNDITQ